MFNSQIKLYEGLILAFTYLIFAFIGYLMGRYIHKDYRNGLIYLKGLARSTGFTSGTDSTGLV